MTRVFVRREGNSSETLSALAVSACVAALTFYVARTLLSRESVELEPPAGARRLSRGEDPQR